MSIIDAIFGRGKDDAPKLGDPAKQAYASAFSGIRTVAKKQGKFTFEQNFSEDIATNKVENRDEILNRCKNQRIEEYEKALGEAEKRWRARYDYCKGNPSPLPYEKKLLTRFANSELFINAIKDILATHKGRHISKYRTAQDWMKAIMGELQTPERDLAHQCDKAIEDLQ